MEDVAMVAHLAGQPIWFNTDEGQILRQRCSWCGTTLIDTNLSRIAVPVGQDPTYPTWEVGKFVERAGHQEAVSMCALVEWEFPAPVPSNACMRMPLEVTT